ncbi:hypothetical protein [Actinoplanes auranticolor]|uniref:Uncharacterized protein n=1 Tax=Actinoplanes auranticolor TaxID=47988 RepID=A0A919ST44_9ACTN|nr:hypothetical protein [Actinoplanes auranticolor]GIM78037.1 hypothetical protein Aau02nite_78930 [Actinoplanes auranticolor]
MADRTITVILRDGTTEEKYAKLANTIWAVASTYEKDFVGVQQDEQADADYLNNWYDKKDGKARWS